MNDIPSEPDPQSIAIGRATRFGFAAIVLGMSYPNICLAMRLDAFAAIFRDMLNGKPLPATTTFILGAQPFFIGVSFLIPVSAVGLIFAGRLTHSLYLSGVLVLSVFLQLFFTWQAMCAPLFQIIKTMAEGVNP
jgi:hypothetical protein